MEADSSDVQAWLLLIRSSRAMDSLDVALEESKRARNYNPESPDLLDEEAAVYLDLGDKARNANNIRQALDHYDSAERLTPDNPVVLQQIAALLLNEGRLDQARDKLTRLLAVTSDSADVNENLESILKRTEKARAYYQKGLDAYSKKTYRTAKSFFNNALKEKPDLDDARYYLHMCEGHLLYGNRDKSDLWDAISEYGNASAIRSTSAEPYYYMAKAYEKKDPDEMTNAIDAYEKAYTLEPEGPFASESKRIATELKTRKDKLDRFWGRKK